MPKNGYDISKIETTLQLIGKKSPKVDYSTLNLLQTQLNSFFTEAKCLEVLYTLNTDHLFFGMCCYPIIDSGDVSTIITGDKPYQVKKYKLEIDSRIYDIGLTTKEITACLLHEIGHIVMDNKPAEQVRAAIDDYFMASRDNYNINVGSNVAEMMGWMISDSMIKFNSMRYKNDDEVKADTFVAMCGYGSHLKSAMEKIARSSVHLTTSVKENKLTVMVWVFSLYKELVMKRIPAIRTLQKAKSYTGSQLEKERIDVVIHCLERASTSLGESARMVTNEAMKKISLFQSIKQDGLRGIEDDLYEFRIRVKNCGDSEEALYSLRQINTRLTILEDYINNMDVNDAERERWLKCYNDYRELREQLSKSKIYERKNYGLFYDYNKLDELYGE